MDGLPARVEAGGRRRDDHRPRTPREGAGHVRIAVRDAQGDLLAESNPLVVTEAAGPSTWWGDFHAQSEETIGTNSARSYFEFARDLAFCDFVGHQGNDFQITGAFWAELNRLYREFDEPGRFVTIPGYEYSPVTHLGGDRNIFFFDEGRPIRRSSHALVEDLLGHRQRLQPRARPVRGAAKDGEKALAFAHVGGRYADLHAGHDVAIERSVEVHSSWGTFEWILFDAFELGYRVGVVCNSDDHKGRPGASHPGASIFGAYGGLTCLYLDELTRAGIWRLHAVAPSLRHDRRPPASGRRAAFRSSACRYAIDPKLDPERQPEPVQRAMMGDIVRRRRRPARLSASASTPRADRARRPARGAANARDDPAVLRRRSRPAHPRRSGKAPSTAAAAA